MLFLFSKNLTAIIAIKIDTKTSAISKYLSTKIELNGGKLAI